MKIAHIIAALTLTIAAPLAAQSADAPVGQNGWGEAQWGMSVDEVMATIGDKGQKSDLKDKDLWLGPQREGARGVTELKGQSYEALYYFAPEGSTLSGLTLAGKSREACDVLESYFIYHLGAGSRTAQPYPVSETIEMTLAERIWREERGGNAFQFVYVYDDRKPVVFCRIRISHPDTPWTRK